MTFLLFLALCQHAQTTSWTGSADSTWHNAANWTAGVPAASVDAVIGDTNYTGINDPKITAAASCRALTINSGRILRVATSNDVVVAGSLTNNGLISSDSLHINFVGNSTINGAGTAVYQSFKVDAGASITLNKNIEISGDLIVDGTLTSAANMVTFSGGNPTTIFGSGSVNLKDVIIDKSAGDVALAIPLNISGNLALTSGLIRSTAAAPLVIMDNATVSGGSNTSYVDGPVKKIGNEAFVFPLGNKDAWARLAISAPALVTDAFIAQYFNAPYSDVTSFSTTSPVDHVSQVEYWTCERSSGSSNVSVTLYWEDNNRSGISDYNALTVAHWNGSAWENAGQLVLTPAPQGNITSQMLGSFSPFTFGSTGVTNVMPITLLGFNAVFDPLTVGVSLDWQTAIEVNNARFEVQRSSDGINFQTIVEVAGGGNSTVKRNYSAVDLSPVSGVSYYRLRQVDFNGKFAYSAIRTVEVKTPVTDIDLYPNPVNGNAFVISSSESMGETVNLSILNQFGETVYASVIRNENQSMLLPVRLNAQMASGIYSVVIAGDSKVVTKRVYIH